MSAHRCTSGHCQLPRPRFVEVCETCEGDVRWERGVRVHCAPPITDHPIERSIFRTVRE